MARRPDNPRPGLVVIDKPQGITSHDAVSRVRRTARTRKAGHAGTLDPMATGVLVVGIGKATKLLTWVSGDTKSYEATIRFGASTRTDDAEGETTSAPGCSHLDAPALGAAFERLRGDIMQVPSAVSAIKVGGRRAYARVRAGEEVELEARPVRVERLDVVGAPRPAALPAHDGGGGGVPVVDVDVVVECSSGTYIRALARDAGTALGCGAHLGVLHVAAGGRQAVVRLRVGGAQRSLEVGLDRYVEQGDDGVPSLLGVRPVERGRFEVSLQRTNVVDPFGGQAHALHRCGDDVGEEGLPGGPSAIGGGPAHPRRLDDLLEADVVHGHGEPAFADLVERALQ